MAIRLRSLAPLALAAILLAGGCSSSLQQQRARYDLREHALRLLDEGRGFETVRMNNLAIERYNRSLVGYETPLAWFRIGQAYETEGMPREAATAYQQALDLAPDYREARLSMLALGYLPEGEQPTPELLRLGLLSRESLTTPTLPRATTELTGQALFATAQEHRIPTSEEVQAVLFAPESAGLTLPSAEEPTFTAEQDIILGTYPYHLRKARQLRRRQQYQKAASEYLRAIRADNSQIDARLELGDMYLRLERPERARFHYQQALDFFPQSPRPYLKLGNYYLEIGDPGQARDYYLQSLIQDPNYIEARNNLAVLAMREKNFDDAMELLEAILELDPEYANAWLNRGIIASDVRGDIATARESFQRYVELGGPREDQVRQWLRDLNNPEE